MDFVQILAQEFHLRPQQVQAVIELTDAGNTIPFIARYRKEMTGSLDDQVLRELTDRLEYLRGLEKRKNEIEKALTEQGVLTEELQEKLNKASTLSELEDIYRPFRPKRRTRATVAKEKGLEPLAEFILKQDLTESLDVEALKYIDASAKYVQPEENYNEYYNNYLEEKARDAEVPALSEFFENARRSISVSCISGSPSFLRTVVFPHHLPSPENLKGRASALCSSRTYSQQILSKTGETYSCSSGSTEYL